MNTKRLTKIYDNGFVTLEAARFAPIAQETIDRNISAFEPFEAAVKRLAEYEDTEKKGLLVRLPCKIDDTVYVITDCDHIHMYRDNNYFSGTGAEECPFESECSCEYCDDIDTKRIFKTVLSGFSCDRTNNYRLDIILEHLESPFTLADFGKNVFLTREEAERALKETDNDSSRND